MRRPAPAPKASTAGARLLIASAVASGLAALVLELQWGRQLALTFGGAQLAVAAVLAAFMLGLGVGSFVGGRVADRLRRPALAVALVELGLVAAGPLLTVLLVRLPAIAAAWLPAVDDADHPLFVGSRLALALVLLAVPTTLMGATYPLLVKAAGADLSRLHRGLGNLYAGSTLGGVAGVLLAGFLVLPRTGIPGSVALAAAGNFVAAVAAFVASRRLAEGAPPPEPAVIPGAPTPALLLAAAAGSGALVLGAETLWHRALVMVLANSTATLTLLLALTLAGLGLGAALGAPLLRRFPPLASWVRLQVAAAALLAIQAALQPELAALVRLLRPDTGWPRVLTPPLLVGGLLVLPATLLFGAAWPRLLEAATPRVGDGGRRIGAMGVVNALGAAAGAGLAGAVLLPAAGFGRSMLAMAGLALGLAALGLAADRTRDNGARRRLGTVALAGCLALAAVAAAAPGFGRVPLPSMTGDAGGRRVLAYRETASGTVVVTEEAGTGARAMYVDNNAVIGASYDALKVARMLGLVPTLLHPRPERVLVIGFGAGVTTATVAAAPEVASLDVVEIVPGVVEAAGLFADLNHGVAYDPRVRLHANDGRNHLLLHPGPWDVITCDPVHPLYGSAPLYSLEFFELAHERLAPGGVVCQYLPLHRMPTGAFRRAVATFQQAFPEAWVLFGLGHAMLVGSNGPLELDWDRWQAVLDGHVLRDDLAASALATPGQIYALLQLDPEGCRAVGRGAPSTDLHPRLEFLAPAAYEPGLWQANARLLVEAYRPPIPRIVNLPSQLLPDLRRLVAGKRLLLFSLLERADGDLEGAREWLARAVQIAGDDPEIALYARQLAMESRER